MSDGRGNDTPFTTDRRDALRLTAGAATLALAPAPALAAATKAAHAPAARALHVGRDQPFDLGWRFRRGAGDGLEVPALDDTSWRKVDLPHDWSIEDLPGNATGPFVQTAEGGTATGFTEGGEGWYRKHFSVADLPADARVEVLFDGIMLESDVWLNGVKVGTSVCGYTPFACDLTPHLDRKGANVLAVRVRNLGRNSRWYAGSGLYRQVRLDVLPAATRIARWGVAAWTRRIAAGKAEITVTTALEQADPALHLVTRLRDAAGKIVAEARSPATAEVHQTLAVRGPRLWSPDSPALYTLETEVQRGATAVDTMVQPFGIRVVTIDPQRGLCINGTPTRLRGGCIHHDNGLLGASAYPDADARRIRQLKARGFNAIRSSHNTMSRSFREACDRLGMLVVNEAFDVWHSGKLPQDFTLHFKEQWQHVIDTLVRSARNSPSVIMWSIGNEIPDRSTDEGVEWEWKLANAVRRIDPTRPVTSGLNGTLGAPMIAGDATARAGRAGKVDNASTVFLDVAGYNYRFDEIELEHAEHPERLVIATESFPKNVFDYAALMERAPYFLGEFVWTALDYVGEAGIGFSQPVDKPNPLLSAAWPWVNAWCGDVDLIGQQKAPSLARDVAWGLSPLEFTVQRPLPAGKVEFVAPWGWSDELQSWNWAGFEGTPMAVRIYTSAQKVQVLLNGKPVAEKVMTATDGKKAEVHVPYAPGTLEVVAWRDGKVIARRTLSTTGAPARLRLVAEQAHARAARDGLAFVRVDVLDAQGRVVPEGKVPLNLTIEGPADLAAFGSANPLAVGSFQQSTAQSFRGRALAIVRSRGTPGAVRLRIAGAGLTGAATLIQFA